MSKLVTFSKGLLWLAVGGTGENGGRSWRRAKK
jgi:hypothetical protein